MSKCTRISATLPLAQRERALTSASLKPNSGPLAQMIEQIEAVFFSPHNM